MNLAADGQEKEALTVSVVYEIQKLFETITAQRTITVKGRDASGLGYILLIPLLIVVLLIVRVTRKA